MRIAFTLLIFCDLLFCPISLLANSSETEHSTTSVYDEGWALDSTKVQELAFDLHSVLFFRNNEFASPMVKGYTLPGFRLRPSFSYRPSERINVEMGVYLLRFWGTNHYPNLSYADIAEWTGESNVTKGFHFLPFFRVQMATASGVNFVLGSIYGGYHHRLLEPLYAPELNLIADPESGAQILYSNRWLDYDMWVNWESFIYKGDTHKEAFTFGVSSRIKFNAEERPVHVYAPIQAIFQHRGGEIDTLVSNSVQTLFNGAVGLGARFDFNHRTFRSLTLEADALVYNQQVGDLLPIDSGWAYYTHARLDMGNLNVKLGYFNSNKFVSLMGYPFFGSVSTCYDGMTVDRYSTVMAGVDYSYDVAPGYTLGANANVYRHSAITAMQDGVPIPYEAKTSFCACLYFRINPSFLIKKFAN